MSTAHSTQPTAISMDILYETIIALNDRAVILLTQIRSDAHEDIKTIARRQLARVETCIAHFENLSN